MKLAKLVRQGVDPPLKAVALRTLAAFALPRHGGLAVPTAELAVHIWEQFHTPSLHGLGGMGIPGGAGGASDYELELLCGIQDDFKVEQRHLVYPQARRCHPFPSCTTSASTSRSGLPTLTQPVPLHIHLRV